MKPDSSSHQAGLAGVTRSGGDPVLNDLAGRTIRSTPSRDARSGRPRREMAEILTSVGDISPGTSVVGAIVACTEDLLARHREMATVANGRADGRTAATLGGRCESRIWARRREGLMRHCCGEGNAPYGGRVVQSTWTKS